MQHNQKKKRATPIPLSEETIQQIIERWKSSKLNSIPTIAAEFNLPQSRIDCIINKYLSSKILP